MYEVCGFVWECVWGHLGAGAPEAHDGLNAAGGEQTQRGVHLHAVEDGLVGAQTARHVARRAAPDEQAAVVRT